MTSFCLDLTTSYLNPGSVAYASADERMHSSSVLGRGMKLIPGMTLSIKRNSAKPPQQTCGKLVWTDGSLSRKQPNYRFSFRSNRPRQLGNRTGLASIKLQFLKSFAACKENIADVFNHKNMREVN